MRTRAMLTVIILRLFSLTACEKKAEQPQLVGNLEITAVPSPLIVASDPGDYIITTTGKETRGTAVNLTNVTVVVTYLDSTHIVLGPDDWTVNRFTWEASSPEEGGPVSELLQEFWHFDSGEEKVFEIPVKIGYGLTAPEGFTGVYFPTTFISLALASGKQGFLLCLDYQGTDEYGHLIAGAAYVRIQFGAS